MFRAVIMNTINTLKDLREYEKQFEALNIITKKRAMKKLDKEQKEHIVTMFAEFLNLANNNCLVPFSNELNQPLLKSFLKEKGLIEEEFEVGRWYKSTENNDNLIYNQYGSTGCGVWNDCWHLYYSLASENGRFVLATDKEVEEALIKEAKRRGFKEGAKTICVSVPNKEEIILNTNSYRIADCRLLVDSSSSVGWVCVYKRGKWATIIEEKKEKISDYPIYSVTREHILEGIKRDEFQNITIREIVEYVTEEVKKNLKE